ncbi:hypothetical protein ACFL1B_02740 [Nanoarchaeota archaeon]
MSIAEMAGSELGLKVEVEPRGTSEAPFSAYNFHPGSDDYEIFVQVVDDLPSPNGGVRALSYVQARHNLPEILYGLGDSENLLPPEQLEALAPNSSQIGYITTTHEMSLSRGFDFVGPMLKISHERVEDRSIVHADVLRVLDALNGVLQQSV